MTIRNRIERLEAAAHIAAPPERPAAVLAVQRIHADPVSSAAAVLLAHAEIMGWPEVLSIPLPADCPAAVSSAVESIDPEAELRRLVSDRVGITL
jgi:hypothetical protein